MRVWLWLVYKFYRELLSLATFLRVHSNWKEVSYLSWQNTYPNLKTTCHIKLKFFLWTKLLENLLLAKYLISRCAFKLLIRGPSKIPAFNFASLASGNVCFMKANAGLSLLMALTKFFINPSFIWRGGSNIWWGLTNGSATTLCELGWNVSLDGHSFCV